MPSNVPVNFARSVLGQGVGLGWGDEAEAWLRAKSQGTDYRDELAKLNQEYAQYAQEHPVLAPVGEFVGGALPAIGGYLATVGSGGAAAPAAVVTTGRALGALGRLASNPWVRGAVIGAVEGGIAGAGAAGPDHRVGGGLTGGFIGGAAGSAIPLATRSVGSVGRWLQERVAPTEAMVTKRAAGKINRALEEASGGKGVSPAEIERLMAVDRARGIPSKVANADLALVEVAETVAQRSGASARRVEKELGEQASGARRRVYDRARKALGGKDYFENEQKLVEELRDKAKGMYDQAYEIGEVTDPRIMRMLEGKDMKRAYQEAREIAETEMEAAVARGENPAKYALPEIYSVDEAGELVLQKVPDVRTLDWIKRGIDASVEKGFRGEGMSSAKASALRNLRREFVNVIDEATTDPVTGISPYKAARQSYAGDMEVIDALRLGREQFKKLSHQEIERIMKEAGSAEKEAFRTGALQHIYEQVMNSPQNINAAQRLVGSPETVAKLAPLFESQSQFRLFNSALQREAQLMQHSQRVLGGAATGRRIQARERFEEGEGVGEALADAMNSGLWPSLVNLAGRVVRSAKMTDEVADKVSQMLMSSDPHEVAAAVKVLERFGSTAKTEAKHLAAKEAGIIGGTAASAPPAPVVENQNPDIESAPTAPIDQEGLPDIELDIENQQR